MPQLSLVHSLNVRCHFIKKIESLFRDRNLYHSPIFNATLANNQLPLLESIQHSCRVGASGDQKLPQRQRLHGCRIDGPKQPEGIVLLSRQLKSREQLLFQSFEAIVGSPQVQKSFLLR